VEREIQRENCARNTQNAKTMTCGEYFSAGTQIELVRPDPRRDKLALLVSKGGVVTETSCAEHDGVSYVPAEPNGSILRAMYIPSGVSEYGTTQSLFAEIMRVFTSRFSLSYATATLLSHFVFATWFADCFVTAPRMLIYGPPEESATLLQLLAATCRRAVLLGDVSISTWSSALNEMRPTLLITTRRLRASARQFLEASKMRNQYVPCKGKLLDLFGAQVIYESSPSGDRSLHDSAICATVTSACGQLLVLSDQDRAQIANDIQRKLLLYRLRNYAKVRESKFDVADFIAPVRSHARTLGASIVNAPELKSSLIAALRGQDEDARTERFFSLESVLVEALVLLCHEKLTSASATVGEIAEKMNVIFQGRGEALKLAPRKVGNVLRALQFFPGRLGSAARGISLLAADRQRIHEIAREFDVPTIHDGVVGCAQCAAMEIAKDRGGLGFMEQSGN
jgi:hypothetical protein